jgi:hypothetical protein
MLSAFMTFFLLSGCLGACITRVQAVKSVVVVEGFELRITLMAAMLYRADQVDSLLGAPELLEACAVHTARESDKSQSKGGTEKQKNDTMRRKECHDFQNRSPANPRDHRARARRRFVHQVLG